MRKQYHFWPGEHGLVAWDVDRLIQLSSDCTVMEISLDSIEEMGTDHWFTDGPGTPSVRRIVEQMVLIQDVDLSFPIILGVDVRVMDGMRRVARALLDGHPTIRAVRFKVQPEPDYRDCSPGDLPV